eukprot:15467767-Alexandrium_andersonii.AAC.1
MQQVDVSSRQRSRGDGARQKGRQLGSQVRRTGRSEGARGGHAQAHAALRARAQQMHAGHTPVQRAGASAYAEAPARAIIAHLGRAHERAPQGDVPRHTKPDADTHW